MLEGISSAGGYEEGLSGKHSKAWGRVFDRIMVDRAEVSQWAPGTAHNHPLEGVAVIKVVSARSKTRSLVLQELSFQCA